jgi:hypothetical protein
MLAWVLKLLCVHHYAFTRNLYGDEINENNGKRSVYTCIHCNKRQTRHQYKL